MACAFGSLASLFFCCSCTAHPVFFLHNKGAVTVDASCLYCIASSPTSSKTVELISSDKHKVLRKPTHRSSSSSASQVNISKNACGICLASFYCVLRAIIVAVIIILLVNLTASSYLHRCTSRGIVCSKCNCVIASCHSTRVPAHYADWDVHVLMRD